jgi:hypothetical protein
VKVIALYGPLGSAASRSRRQSIVALMYRKNKNPFQNGKRQEGPHQRENDEAGRNCKTVL